MDERERSIIAAHEAGHAICGRVHGEARRVEEISLYQHGEAIGVTVSSGEDNSLPAADDLRAQLVALMGGRAAEELCFREITGGASNDFEKATEIARHMVRVWGIGADPRNPAMTGVAIVGSDEGASLDLRESRERAERAIIEAALIDARRTLISHREQLDRVSAYLFEHERIDGEEFARVFEGTLLPTSTDLGAWRVAGSHPRDWSEIDQIAIDISQPAIEPVAFPTPPLDTDGRSSYVGVPIEVAKTLALLPLDMLKTLADLPVEMLKDAVERGRRGGKGPGVGA
jgi:cell division protease FtsH